MTRCNGSGKFFLSLFFFLLVITPAVYAQQPPGQTRLPEPLLEKLHGPAAFKARLEARKMAGKLAQAKKAVEAVPGQKACAPTCDKLLAKAHEKGSVYITVRLNVVDLPPVANAQASVETQHRTDQLRKEAIVREQKRFLAKLSGQKITRVQTSEFTAGVTMAIDAAGLQVILSYPEVRSVSEVGLLDLQLMDSGPLIGAPQAWNAGFTGNGYTIAVLDSGVDRTHPFLFGKVVAEACFSGQYPGSTSLCPSGSGEQTGVDAARPCTGMFGCEHGTHVAGIAAGNGSSFSGVARDVNIIAINIASRLDDSVECFPYSPPCLKISEADIDRALAHVYSLRNTYNISAVNLSVGGYLYNDFCDSDPRWSDINEKIINLRGAGIAAVIAAGNNGNSTSLSGPACLSSAVSVGATMKSDVVATYSNSASFLSLLAPGGDRSGGNRDIYSSIPGGGFAYGGGTSQAAPHVAGAFAVLKQQSPTANVNDILSMLKSNGVPITDPRNNVTKPRIRLNNSTSWLSRYATVGEDMSVAVLTDIQGNVYVAGNSQACDGCGRFDVIVVKYDSRGNLLWDRRYSGGTHNHAVAATIDSSANVFVAAWQCNDTSLPYAMPPCQDADYVTIKYDSNGNQIWARVFDGGIYGFPTGIATDTSGNAYVTGSSCTAVTVYGQCAASSVNTVKYSSSGDQLWASANGNLRYPGAVVLDRQANVYVTGADCGDIDCSTYLGFTMKYDTNGTLTWSRSFGGGTSNEFSSVAIDASGNPVVAGAQCIGPSYPCYDSNFLTVKYDTNGNQFWARTYGSGGEAMATATDSQSNIVVVGHVCTSFDPSEGLCADFDYSTVKYDQNGNQLWATTIANPIGGDDRLTNAAIDISGNAFVTGYVCKTFESGGPYPYCSDFDYTTIKYSPAGAQLWSATYSADSLSRDHGSRLTQLKMYL